MDKSEPRQRPVRLLACLAIALLAGCAASPLYTAGGSEAAVTSGEIPRDSRGEPVWHLIRAAPPGGPVPAQLARPAAAPEAAEGSAGGFAPR